MPSERDAILEKIRKLLAVGQSTGSEAESQNAMAHAERLMRKYNISLASVESAEIQSGEWIEEAVHTGKRMRWEQPFVLQIVQEFFFCKVIVLSRTSRGRLVEKVVQLFGDSHNVEIGRCVFVYLSRTFRQLWADARKERGLKKRHARTFYMGLADGFASRLRSERKQDGQQPGTNGLIRVAGKLQQAFDSQYGDLPSAATSPVTPDSSAYSLGFRDGKSITLRDAIRNSAAETARIGN